MDTQQISEVLNRMAKEEGFEIANLPHLRKKHLNKKKLPLNIFTGQTIFPSYAFHHGGRDEFQFNFGSESIAGKQYTRYALCLSLEPSHSLPKPTKTLNPFRIRFNECLDLYPEYFEGFEMWHFPGDKRLESYMPSEITEEDFYVGNFIALGGLIEKPLDKLDYDDMRTILEGFDNLLPIYKFCVLNIPLVPRKLRIFTRLTSNENNWELPSPHKWRKEDQGKNNIPFENQYGFGHEEWLFNPRYNIGGFQYGFIRGIQLCKGDIRKYDEVHLYTIKKEKGNNLVYYLGLIRNVLVIKNDKDEQRLINQIIDAYYNDMQDEVKAISGDLAGIRKYRHKMVVKFRMTDVSFLEIPVYQPDFDLEKYKRFQPYKMGGPLNEVFSWTINTKTSVFISGKSNQTDIYNRKNKASSVQIIKLHSEITESLEEFLKPAYSLLAENISIDKMRFNGNIADIVTAEKDNSISIFEIKTSSSGRRNIREAIGQLLDYALHADDLKVKKLVIVSPSKLSSTELNFLNELKNKINIPIEYLAYQKDNKPQFVIQ